MAQSAKDVVTAYNVSIPPQNQTPSAGLDSKLKPAANFTQLEAFDDNGKPYLKEYEGRGQLKDKAALVTGGDSGIGRSVAVLFAREGADVSIAYLPEEEEDAQITRQLVEKENRRCHLIASDLREPNAPKSVIDSHLAALGKLNILVNNASRQEVCPNHADIDMNQVQSTFQLNIIAMMALAKYALQHMRRGDAIVNSTSVAAYMSNPELVDYTATKGAITSFTRALALQQAPKGIRVNAVAPGIMWTPLQPATRGNAPEKLRDIGVGEAPMQRPGQPVECATAYVFLASPMGSYTTGETIHVNGGLEVQG